MGLPYVHASSKAWCTSTSLSPAGPSNTRAACVSRMQLHTHDAACVPRRLSLCLNIQETAAHFSSLATLSEGGGGYRSPFQGGGLLLAFRRETAAHFLETVALFMTRTAAHFTVLTIEGRKEGGGIEEPAMETACLSPVIAPY